MVAEVVVQGHILHQAVLEQKAEPLVVVRVVVELKDLMLLGLPAHQP